MEDKTKVKDIITALKKEVDSDKKIRKDKLLIELNLYNVRKNNSSSPYIGKQISEATFYTLSQEDRRLCTKLPDGTYLFGDIELLDVSDSELDEILQLRDELKYQGKSKTDYENSTFKTQLIDIQKSVKGMLTFLTIVVAVEIILGIILGIILIS